MKVGTQVLYTLNGGNNPGEQRPALILREQANKLHTLAVFVDTINDDLGGPILNVVTTEGTARGQFQLPTPEAPATTKAKGGTKAPAPADPPVTPESTTAPTDQPPADQAPTQDGTAQLTEDAQPAG